jgi:4-hydroxybenzoate polyprenyltransferase
VTEDISAARVSTSTYFRQLFKLMRPTQWWKNGFVLVGLFFGHAWSDPQLLTQALVGMVAFCLVSSSVYILNDILDREADRLHPKKKYRPIASGTIPVTTAAYIGIALFIFGTVLAWWVSWIALGLIVFYAGLNIAYSAVLKHVVIIDAFVISAGFMIRVLVGTLGIGIIPSQWMLLCTTMVTLFLAFTKRRAEFILVAQHQEQGRKVLSQYSPELLDSLIGITAACTILSYSLYTTSADTIRLHHTNYLIFTVPIVAYGIFRYLYLLHRWNAGENPAQELLADPHMLGTVVAWALLTVFLIY